MVHISKTPKDDTDFSDEHKHQVLERKKAMDKLLSDECIGKFKIELMFSSKHSITKPSPGAISIWESGAKLHGGGDAKVYFCPGRRRGVNDCSSIVPASNANYGHVLCPKCGKVWKGKEVDGEVIGRHTIQEWAALLEKYFVELGHNADIYVKYPKSDIRKAAEQEQEKQHKGDKLLVVRAGLKRVIYPLKRIIADTSGGSAVYDRFLAMLKS